MALISRQRQAQIAHAILTTLKSSNEPLSARQVVDAVMTSILLSPEEMHRYDRGQTRFEVYLRFISTTLAKADFIRKAKGRWYLTEEGDAHAVMDAKAAFDAALTRYSAWKMARGDVKPDEIEPPEITLEDEIKLSLETAEETALAEIKQAIDALGPYEFQYLVAALLRGMGYQTPFIAPKGPDGGTDILAYLDPLGAKTPHIRVQVKHRNDPARGPEIAGLLGNINHQREIGLFVSSAGFTKDARQKMMQSQAHLELIDLDRFIDLWIDHYAKMTDADKSLLPLRPVYFLAPSKPHL